MKSLTIGKVALESPFVLAPMAGYTDAGMRELCAEAGAGMTVTEMVSAKGLLYSPDKSGELLIAAPSEQVRAVQLFGSEPNDFKEVLLSCERLLGFDIIDINMGCPVPKIVKNGEGSALMCEPKRAEAIVRAAVSASGDRPVTVKTRLGFEENEFTAIEFCKRMQGAGASAITLHGRTRSAGYSGYADWNKIAEVRAALDIPLIGSGDANAENGNGLLSFADGVMIGRAAIGNPNVFSDLRGERRKKTRAETAIRHMELLSKYYGERYAVINMRKHYAGYLRALRGAKGLKVRLLTSDDDEEVKRLIRENFDREIFDEQ